MAAGICMGILTVRRRMFPVGWMWAWIAGTITRYHGSRCAVSYEIICQDVMEWAASYSGPKFHAILCDPPYEYGFRR